MKLFLTFLKLERICANGVTSSSTRVLQKKDVYTMYLVLVCTLALYISFYFFFYFTSFKSMSNKAKETAKLIYTVSSHPTTTC